MKTLTLTLGLASALLAGCSNSGGDHAGHAKGDKDHKGHAHGGHATAALYETTEPASPVAGQPAALNLMVHGAGGEMLKDFAVVHDRKIHLVVIREGLDRFAHLHPDVAAAGNITTPLCVSLRWHLPPVRRLPARRRRWRRRR